MGDKKPFSVFQALDSEAYERLCNCRSIKSDILPVAQSVYSYYRRAGKTQYGKEDALVYAIELLDQNSCSEILDLTEEEYRDILESIV